MTEKNTFQSAQAATELSEIIMRDIAVEETSSDVQAKKSEVDVKDSTTILFFGSKAQHQLTELSDQMLEGVRNKDVGDAGGALNDAVSVLRGFDVTGFDPNKSPGWFDRILGRAKPVAKFMQQYEDVKQQIERITHSLEKDKTVLLTDITLLDKLYDANLSYFRELEQYIVAGDSLLHDLDTTDIPQLQQECDSSDDMLLAQSLRDLRAARDDLERRVHDLKLTRQVAMQALPGIRLIQENDKSLVNKISSTIVNTIPLWRQQLATAMTIHHSQQAANSVKAATDLTNSLLQANAETLKSANKAVRTEVERGVFDIEAIEVANRNLIETIEESLQIADEGKRKRALAEQTLQQCEAELKQTLAAASAREKQPM